MRRREALFSLLSQTQLVSQYLKLRFEEEDRPVLHVQEASMKTNKAQQLANIAHFRGHLMFGFPHLGLAMLTVSVPANQV